MDTPTLDYTARTIDALVAVEEILDRNIDSLRVERTDRYKSIIVMGRVARLTLICAEVFPHQEIVDKVAELKEKYEEFAGLLEEKTGTSLYLTDSTPNSE